MATVFSTRDVHPRDRVAYWLEVATRAFVPHAFAARSGSLFDGMIRSGSLADLGISEFECDPCLVTRSVRDVARGDSDDALLSLQLAGKCIYGQEGRQAVSERGSFVLLDTRRPYTVDFSERTRAVTFRFARQALEARVGNIRALTARAVESAEPAAGLAYGFLLMLAERLDALDRTAGTKLAEQALDLIALALSAPEAQRGLALSSSRANTLLRLKSAIEARLSDPDLKPATAAAAAGISVRYANDLLSAEDFSMERYVLHRRLERCRHALDDPRQAHRSIGEIAFGWGFSDPSHFARRFRAAYGVSPTEFRQRRQTPAGYRNGGAGIGAGAAGA